MHNFFSGLNVNALFSINDERERKTNYTLQNQTLEAASYTMDKSEIIIIGAGIFGLSAAPTISRCHPNYRITVIDRPTPVEDGTRVDSTHCIRADMLIYLIEKLARINNMPK